MGIYIYICSLPPRSIPFLSGIPTFDPEGPTTNKFSPCGTLRVLTGLPVKMFWTSTSLISRGKWMKNGYHGNPQPWFLGVISYNPYIGGFKTFIFHGFGVQGYLAFQLSLRGHILECMKHVALQLQESKAVWQFPNFPSHTSLLNLPTHKMFDSWSVNTWLVKKLFSPHLQMSNKGKHFL